MTPMAATRTLLRYTELPLIRTGVRPSFDWLPDGTLHAARADNILLNLLLGCPVGGALHRIALSIRDGQECHGMLLAGPGSGATFSANETSARWSVTGEDLAASATLVAFDGGWQVDVVIENRSSRTLSVQAVHGMDLALTTQFAARLNESYTSQYVDHRDLPDSVFGRALASRQNLAVDGKNPWLIQTWVEGTAGFQTEAAQFFGRNGQRGDLPKALIDPPAPGRVKQEETSYTALFSEPLQLAPGETGTRRFLAVFRDHHAEASGPADTAFLHEALAGRSAPGDIMPAAASAPATPRLEVRHGEKVSRETLGQWFPGPWLHEETSEDGVRSFFHGGDRRHVVTFAKEADASRPHALILRSGSAADAGNDTLDTTCHMAGVFQSLVSVGHPSFHRLLSPVRERFGLIPSSGQRIGIETDGCPFLLGIPSAFEMSLRSCRWFYRIEGRLIEVTTTVDDHAPRSETRLRILEGPPASFLITQGLVGGEREGEEPATLHIEGARATLEAAAGSLAKQYFPDCRFTADFAPASALDASGGNELIGGTETSTTHLVFRTHETTEWTVTFGGFTHEATEAEPSRSIWDDALGAMRLSAEGRPEVARVDTILPWFVHNGLIHYSVPHGLEQWNGGAWGTRDVTQGSVELLLALDRPAEVRDTLARVFSHQYRGSGDWPQWFMLPPFGWIQQRHMHGDVPLWPLKALCDYLEATEDFAFLEETIDWHDPDTARPTGTPTTLHDHVTTAVGWMRRQCFPGTCLMRYGEGDWDDSLQPARPELREHMVSSWTVALSYQVLRRLEEVCSRCHRTIEGLEGFADGAKRDFQKWLLPDGTTCGFFVFDKNGKSGRPLLHPRDEETGIHYRLLPMKRAILAELFTPAQAEHHLPLIRRHLVAKDGARLMDRPAPYHGGPRKTFERAESAAAFSREIGVFYTHAHLRYLEMLARLGEADALWHGLSQANPVEIGLSVPHALPRQANLYFSSSDAAVHDRYEAAERYPEIVSGDIPVAGGWRLYSSGPGLFCQVVRTRVLGLRRHYDRITLDPVLPYGMETLHASLRWQGAPIEVTYHRRNGGHTITATLNGTPLEGRPHTNPYRHGGLSVPADTFCSLLKPDGVNRLQIDIGG